MPRGFLLCTQTLLKLTKNQGFSIFLLRKRKKPTQTLISVPWKVSQAFSSTEKTIAVLSSILSLAFHCGFLSISPQTGFFHTKCVETRTPTPFLLDNTFCSSSLKSLGYFPYIYATVVTNT